MWLEEQKTKLSAEAVLQDQQRRSMSRRLGQVVRMTSG